MRPYLKKTIMKKSGVAQGIGPEFKPQYCKKEKRRKEGKGKKRKKEQKARTRKRKKEGKEETGRDFKGCASDFLCLEFVYGNCGADRPGMQYMGDRA
jgi:hypothetical protein